MSINIFISHSSKDMEFSEKLARDIKSATGIECWLDKYEIKAGECILTKIGEGLTKCDYLVLVLSPDSVNSGWVDKEWKTKYWDEVSTGKTILIPALYKECTIPKLIQTKKYANFKEDHYKGMFELLSSIIPRILNINQIKPVELIQQVQSKQILLSEGIAIALQIAKYNDYNELITFCMTELTGKRDKTKDPQFYEYRKMKSFVTLDMVYSAISLHDMRNHFIQNNDRCQEFEIYSPETINTIERFALDDDKGICDRYLTYTEKSDIIQNLPKGHPIYRYCLPSEIISTYGKIKTKFIELLLEID